MTWLLYALVAAMGYGWTRAERRAAKLAHLCDELRAWGTARNAEAIDLRHRYDAVRARQAPATVLRLRRGTP